MRKATRPSLCSSLLLSISATLVVPFVLCSSLTAEPSHPPEGEVTQTTASRLFEMRTYTTAPGKLDNLHTRFRDHTNYLFVKHGMSLIAYWIPQETPNTLIYILAYPDMESRTSSWKAFMADPEWQRVWAASKEEAGGAIVTKVESIFMTPTDYSPIH